MIQPQYQDRQDLVAVCSQNSGRRSAETFRVFFDAGNAMLNVLDRDTLAKLPTMTEGQRRAITLVPVTREVADYKDAMRNFMHEQNGMPKPQCDINPYATGERMASTQCDINPYATREIKR